MTTLKTNPHRATQQARRHAAREAQQVQRQLMDKFSFKAAVRPPHGSAPVNVARLAADTSYGAPVFVSRGYYLDQPFTCSACGTGEVWTAYQQKWWYETAKGPVWTPDRSCGPCRRRERARIVQLRRHRIHAVARNADSQGLN